MIRHTLLRVVFKAQKYPRLVMSIRIPILLNALPIPDIKGKPSKSELSQIDAELKVLDDGIREQVDKLRDMELNFNEIL